MSSHLRQRGRTDGLFGGGASSNFRFDFIAGRMITAKSHYGKMAEPQAGLLVGLSWPTWRAVKKLTNHFFQKEELTPTGGYGLICAPLGRKIYVRCS
jgi:hypothetical protein